MRCRGGTLALLLVAAMASRAQSVDKLAERHARINALYEAENYAGTIREIDMQIGEAAGTTWEDSIFQYLYKYGRAHRKLKDAAAGVTAAEHIYSLVRQHGKAEQELEALFDLSWTYYDVGRMKDCARVDSIGVLVSDSDPRIPIGQRGRARQYLAFDYSILGDHLRSAQFARSALDLYATADSIPAKQWAESYTAVGAAYWHLGRINDAEDYYERALDVLSDGNDPEILTRKASAFGNLGIMWQGTGDLVRARSAYQESLHFSDLVIKRTSDPFMRDEATMGKARTYLNIATIYFELGDNARARELLEMSWHDRASVLEADDPQLIGVKERMADLEMAGGSLDKARSLAQEYLDACTARLGTHSAEYVRTCYKLAKIAAEQGDLVRADSLFTRSMEVGRSLADPSTDPDLASTLRDRSTMYLQAGRYADAMADLVRAREIMVRIHGPVHYKVAQIDVFMAEVAFQDGNMDAAIAHSSSALEKVKGRMDRLHATTGPVYDPSPELLPDAIYWHVRAQHEKDRSTAPPGRWNEEIDLAVDALARNRHTITDDASRLYIVGSQKRLFDLAIDLAFEDHARTGLGSDLDRFLRLTEADRSILLKGRLNMFASLKFADVPDSIRAREQEIIGSLDVDMDDPGTAQDLDRTERAYKNLLSTLERDYPKYYRLRYGEPQIGLAEVRKSLLGPDRDLLVYAATPDHLYILLVTEKDAELHQVDGKDLADAVRRSRKAVIARDARAAGSANSALYQMVFQPVADRSRAKGLLVVPDADLHLIDLEMLPTGRMRTNGGRPELLLDRYAITYLLSATTAIQFAGLKGDRAEGALAVAPGFSDRMKQDYVSRVHDPLLIDQRFINLVRQPFAVRTAEVLGGLLSAKVMLGGEASERRFRSMSGRYGILHLGTHAEMNEIAPLYSYLVFDKDGDGMGSDGDGYLHAYEIFDLDLRAQLAVLTACETGIGKESNGEGVRSLAYGFAYAGCPSLVMSLWNVDERSSSEVITNFYAALADGMPKDEALRAAKLHYLEDASGDLREPYYWAGLLLVGDPAPIRSLGHRPVWPWLLGGLLLLLAGYGWYRRRS